jgi:mannose-6-phosphate isomerase-like protein (cupin superfamily)
MDQLSVVDWVPGVELTRPATGERVRLVKTAADTGGAFVEGVSAYPPTLAETALHEHPHQVERLEVVSGTLFIRWAGKQQLVGPGETLVIPPGEAHEIASAGAETAEVIWQFIPALRTDAFLRSALETRGPNRTGRLQRLAKRLIVAAEFSDEYRKATLPWVVQRPFFALLRTVNRSLKRSDTLHSNGGARGIDLFGERIGC